MFSFVGTSRADSLIQKCVLFFTERIASRHLIDIQTIIDLVRIQMTMLLRYCCQSFREVAKVRSLSKN